MIYPVAKILLLLLIPILIWETVWKGIAMWKAGRNNQLPWFICILIFNTVGILPILYLLFFQKNNNIKPEVKKSRRK